MALSGAGSASAIKAGRAVVELFADNTGLNRTLASTRNRLRQFSKMPVSIGMAVSSLGGLGVGMGLGGGLSRIFDALGDTAKMSATAKAMGLTVEQFTAIAGVATSAGEPLREFIESLVTMGKVIDEGLTGKGELSPQFFKDIGVPAQEFKRLRTDEQFFKVFDAIRQVEDQQKRVRLLMVAFGEDGGKYLLPLLSRAPNDLRALGASLAMSTEEAEQAERANLAYAKTTAQLDLLWKKVVAAMSPAIASVSKFVEGPIADLSRWVSRNPGATAAIVAVVGAVVAAGLTLAGIGGAALLAASALGGVVALVGFLANPITLLAVAIAGLVAAVMAGTVALVLASKEARGAVGSVGRTLAGMWTAIRAMNPQLPKGIFWQAGLPGQLAENAANRGLEFANRTADNVQNAFRDTWNGIKAFFGGRRPDAVARNAAEETKRGPLPGTTSSVLGAFDSRSFAGVFGGAGGDGKVMIAELKAGNEIARKQLEMMRQGLHGAELRNNGPLKFRP